MMLDVYGNDVELEPVGDGELASGQLEQGIWLVGLDVEPGAYLVSGDGRLDGYVRIGDDGRFTDSDYGLTILAADGGPQAPIPIDLEAGQLLLIENLTQATLTPRE
jgi:hypothetical protein